MASPRAEPLLNHEPRRRCTGDRFNPGALLEIAVHQPLAEIRQRDGMGAAVGYGVAPRVTNELRTNVTPAGVPFMERSRHFRRAFKPCGYAGYQDGRRRSPVARDRLGMMTADAVICATCEIEVVWPPIRRHGRTYCCAGCAAGGPCTCSYDQAARADRGAGHHRCPRDARQAWRRHARTPPFAMRGWAL